eukprot:s35_g10.t1
MARRIYGGRARRMNLLIDSNEIMDFDVRSLVTYWDDEDSDQSANPKVREVREFHVAKALWEGQQELLSEPVPSQWGLVHLFDLCLRFGHIDTALALAKGGVKGCRLRDQHLKRLPDATHWALVPRCCCNGWTTCRGCCWGFPVDHTRRMKDWDRNLRAAAYAARQAAKTLLVSGILDMSSRNEPLPIAMSDKAFVRLLDIAILCGHVEAAANLAKTCQARPLRRWTGEELWDRRWLPTISAALFAGAELEGLHRTTVCAEIPLLRALALDFEPEDWQRLGQFFPPENTQWPACDVKMGGWFQTGELIRGVFRRTGVSVQRVQNALRARWNLMWISARLREGPSTSYFRVSLLDLAILCGSSDSARALALAGVELDVECLDRCRRACCHGESLGELHLRIEREDPDPEDDELLGVASPIECQSAASAAARACLKRSFKREGCEGGILYQTLAKTFPASDVPTVVRVILAFSMEAPKIVDQLDLWGDVTGWID